jgi:hypothetical protein
LLALETGDGITPDWQPWGYHGIYTNLAGNIVSYFNTNDGLLNAWTYNQENFKPPSASSTYEYDGTNSWNFVNIDAGDYYLVTDPQESRAMVARSRTLAIGEQGPITSGGAQGVVQSTVDIHAQFGIGSSWDEHSAFYTRPIQTIWPFYDQILESLSIPNVQQ